MGFLTASTRNPSPCCPPGHLLVSASYPARTALGRQSRTLGRHSRTQYR
uniref:ELF6 n=1 Tax=Arundo donax TaxID=35708 RepID=A0A0A9HTA4_ARUDO